MNNNQRWVNSRGDYVTQDRSGRSMTLNNGNSPGNFFERIGGKTYAWIHARPVYDYSTESAIKMVDRVREFAQSLGVICLSHLTSRRAYQSIRSD